MKAAYICVVRCTVLSSIPKPESAKVRFAFGQRLQSLRLEEIDGTLYFAEKHLTLID